MACQPTKRRCASVAAMPAGCGWMRGRRRCGRDDRRCGTARETLVGRQLAGRHIDRHRAIARHPPAVKFRVDPAVRITAPRRAEAAHLGIDPVQMRHQHDRHRIGVERPEPGKTGRQIGGIDRRALEMHQHRVECARPAPPDAADSPDRSAPTSRWPGPIGRSGWRLAPRPAAGPAPGCSLPAAGRRVAQR